MSPVSKMLYNKNMYHWSVDVDFLKKYPEKYRIWRLEQLINFGLQKEKLSKKELVKYFGYLDLDSSKRKYLKFLLK